MLLRRPLVSCLLLAALTLGACAPEPAPRSGDHATATVSEDICAPYDRSLLDAMEPQAQVAWLTERMKTCKAACEEAGTCDQDTAAMAIDFYNRANAQAELERYGEAVADYSRSLTYDPEFVPAYAERANSLVELGRYEEALADTDAAVARAPQDPRTHALRCLVLMDLERYDEAAASCDTAFALAPGMAPLHVIQGMLLARGGKHDAALAQIEEAIASDPAVVSVLQKELAKDGYYAGPQSGSYDKATRDAVKAWVKAGAPDDKAT
jgi:tetratricopeptide (TPR) repeat protein